MKLFLVLMMLPFISQAATIAVIDSGVDVEHIDFNHNIWMNPNETENNRDQDGNGYQDDIYGWNFAENNNLVLDRKYLGTFSQDPHKFFEIQGKMFIGTATQADIDWLKEKREDPAFIKEMGIFGNFVHGTHVAGITVENTENLILSIKLIPTEVKPFIAAALKTSKMLMTEDARMKLLKKSLDAIAAQQMKLMEEISLFVNFHKADIANGSFGTGFRNIKPITDKLFKGFFFRNPTEEESIETAKYLLGAMIKSGEKMMTSAPSTLFVFAAGNDKMNNDIYPTSPTNIKMDNSISVAATYKYDFIAPFSNYGEEMVEVAAPGMLIHSQIPGNEYLAVSGTSQAAPFVANVAAEIKNANPSLLPVEIKKILMGTVDKKAFLKGFVKAAGIVNKDRAVFAAKNTFNQSIDEAITLSLGKVADVKSSFGTKMKRDLNFIEPIALPSLIR